MPLEDSAKVLQTAARLYGKCVSPGEPVTKVAIFGAHGRIAVLKVPLGTPLPATAAEVFANSPTGWSFNGAAHFNGEQVDVPKSRVELLRILAEASVPLTLADIRKLLKTTAKPATIRWHISKLRESLRLHFRGAGDIDATPLGYVLAPK